MWRLGSLEVLRCSDVEAWRYGVPEVRCRCWHTEIWIHTALEAHCWLQMWRWRVVGTVDTENSTLSP
jgi:hypothetical protein